MDNEFWSGGINRLQSVSQQITVQQETPRGTLSTYDVPLILEGIVIPGQLIVEVSVRYQPTTELTHAEEAHVTAVQAHLDTLSRRMAIELVDLFGDTIRESGRQNTTSTPAAESLRQAMEFGEINEARRAAGQVPLVDPGVYQREAEERSTSET